MTDRSRFLSASLATQEKWLDENYPDHLLDAHNDSELGWLIIGLEEEMAEYIASVQFGDAIGEVIYNTATDLSLVRVNQIDGGAPLTDGEKEVLRAHIIEVELDSFGGTHMANACTYVSLSLKNIKYFQFITG